VDGSESMESLNIVPVLAGGGGRLPAHIGVLQAINELGLGYSTLVGVSGGSIVGALAVAGYSLDEIHRIALDTEFSRFSSQNLFTLLRTGGFSNGDSFQAWMDDLLDRRTFADLERDFHVVATDVRSGKPVIFSRDTHPDTPVALAVRFSMSVPILFSFKEYGDHLLVDGSILSEDALQREWSGETPVVVFKLRSDSHRSAQRRSVMPLRTYLEMLVHTFMTAMSREYINERFWLSTIVIDTGDISPVDLHLNLDDKERLYSAGYETTLRVLPEKLRRSAAIRSSH
jgi:NTE family protein